MLYQTILSKCTYLVRVPSSYCFLRKKNRHLKGCLYMEHTCNLYHGGLHVLSAHLGQHFPSSTTI